jgi:hypothetical protein
MHGRIQINSSFSGGKLRGGNSGNLWPVALGLPRRNRKPLYSFTDGSTSIADTTGQKGAKTLRCDEPN